MYSQILSLNMSFPSKITICRYALHVYGCPSNHHAYLFCWAVVAMSACCARRVRVSCYLLYIIVIIIIIIIIIITIIITIIINHHISLSIITYQFHISWGLYLMRVIIIMIHSGSPVLKQRMMERQTAPMHTSQFYVWMLWKELLFDCFFFIPMTMKCSILQEFRR